MPSTINWLMIPSLYPQLVPGFWSINSTSPKTKGRRPLFFEHLPGEKKRGIAGHVMSKTQSPGKRWKYFGAFWLQGVSSRIAGATTKKRIWKLPIFTQSGYVFFVQATMYRWRRLPLSFFPEGPYKPICRDCAIYLSITVIKTIHFAHGSFRGWCGGWTLPLGRWVLLPPLGYHVCPMRFQNMNANTCRMHLGVKLRVKVLKRSSKKSSKRKIIVFLCVWLIYRRLGKRRRFCDLCGDDANITLISLKQHDTFSTRGSF